MTFLKNGFGLLLVIITFCLLKFSNPLTVESFYSTKFFFWFRNFFNLINHFFSFPLSYLFLGLAFAFLFYLFFLFFKSNQSKRTIFFRIFNFLGLLFFLFYLLWGFNYNRPTLESKLLNSRDKIISKKELTLEISKISGIAIELRRQMIPDSLPFSINISDKEMGEMVKGSLGQSIPQFQNLIQNIPVRPLPDGLLMNCGIVGQYFPFTGESNFDIGMHDIKKPVVIAHELFHAMGHCLESDCDFLAYHYMKSSNSNFIRYSAEMEYLGYLLKEFKNRDSITFKMKLPLMIPNSLKMDFDAIKENRLKYQGLFSIMGDGVNNLFLMFQGIDEGVKSYDKLVLMVNRWKVVSQKEKLEKLIFKSK